MKKILGLLIILLALQMHAAVSMDGQTDEVFEEDWRLVENNLYSVQLPSSWDSMDNYLNKTFFERKVNINGVPVNLYTTAWQKETENIIDAAGLIINSYEILDNKRLSYQDLQSILKESMSVSIVKTLKSFVTEMRKEYVFLIKNRRICNYLVIRRLFGMLENWVTR